MPNLNIQANEIDVINNKTLRIVPDFINEREYFSSANGQPITITQHQTLLQTNNTYDGSPISVYMGTYINNGFDAKIIKANSDFGVGSIIQQLDGKTGVLLKKSGVVHIARDLNGAGYTSSSDKHNYAAYVGFETNPKSNIPEGYDMDYGSAYDNYGVIGLNGNGKFVMDILKTSSSYKTFCPKYNDEIHLGEDSHRWKNLYLSGGANALGVVTASDLHTTGGNVALYTNSNKTTRKVLLANTGYLKLGSTHIDDSYNIYLNGTNITTTSTSGYFAGVVLQGKGASSSDIRLKNIIEDLSEEESIKILKDYRAVKFYWKNDEEKNIMYGTVAQDLRDSLLKNNIQNPGLVLNYNMKTEKLSYDLNDPETDDMSYSVDYTSLINPLIKGWQAHEKEIAELKEEIKKLKGGK